MFKQIVRKNSESILMVENLLEKLQTRYPGVQWFQRANILSNIIKIVWEESRIYGEEKKVIIACRIAWFG